MEKLKKYLSDGGMTQREFAAHVGITPEYLSRIMNGVFVPGASLRKVIEYSTGGHVPKDSWQQVSNHE